MQRKLQEPGPWEGTVTHNTEVVCRLISYDLWDKVKSIMQFLVDMEDKKEGSLDRAKMELIESSWYTCPELIGT